MKTNISHSLGRLLLVLTLAGSGRFTPSLHAQGNRPAPLPEGVRTVRDIAYVENGHPQQKLDLYLPAAADVGAPRPLVIWVHGGGWKMGDKRQCAAARLVTDGYVVASVNYRLSQDAVFPAQIEDCKAAVRWLRAHAADYAIDPKRFAAWGSSAGGHLVALLGTTGKTTEFDVGKNLDVSSAVQVVVDFFGPSDLLTMGKMGAATGPMDHDAANSPESQLLGGPVQANAALARRASPTTYVQAGTPPFLIVHGDADPVVALGQSKLLDEKLRAAGNASTLYVVKGGGHGLRFGPDVTQTVSEFLRLHLKSTEK